MIFTNVHILFHGINNSNKWRWSTIQKRLMENGESSNFRSVLDGRSGDKNKRQKGWTEILENIRKK